jgi:putative MATE family efflux protein
MKQDSVASGLDAVPPTGQPMATAARPVPVETLAPRTRLLLEGAIVPTLLRMALPNVVVMVAQAAVGVIETYFVSGLGTDALAGVSLVFPLLMLMQMMSAGSMGGGVSSAIARALGGGRRQDAQALVLHSAVIAVAFGAAFSVALVGAGPWIYALLGGRGAALEAAITYSNIVFLGAIPLWLLNTLASVLRGTGTMWVPAAVILGGAVLSVGLSPLLIYGWGPVPALQVVGAGIAVVTYYLLGVALLAGYLLSGRAAIALVLRNVRLRWHLFWEILRVGLLSSLGSLQFNLTVVIVTGLVGTFGTAALAGYGIGARLEYMQIPLAFGFGSALVAMVGTNFGAGQIARAHRIGWTGASLAGGMTLTIGLAGALWPGIWAGFFSTDASVIAAATDYLHWVGPAYGFLGMGMALYFASQGAARMLFPILAGTLRLVVAGAGSWILVRGLGTGLWGIFLMLAVALVLFGTTTAGAIAAGAWRRKPSLTRSGP